MKRPTDRIAALPPCHKQLVIFAKRSVQFATKLECLSKKTTADKVLAFLRATARTSKSPTFEIPYTRQQLANDLNIKRSALSTVISQLVRDGIIETDHKAFRFCAETVGESRRGQSPSI